MNMVIKPLLIFSLTCLLSACALFGKPSDWSYREDAIRLHIRSDPQLNLYKGTPHTLMICVYQLKDPNALNQLLNEKDWISKLLECNRFDPSVTNAKRFVIHPDQSVLKLLHRAEGTKYISIVAGYYMLDKDRVFRMFEIPVSFVTNKPKKVDVYLDLGPQDIQGMRRE